MTHGCVGTLEKNSILNDYNMKIVEKQVDGVSGVERKNGQVVRTNKQVVRIDHLCMFLLIIRSSVLKRGRQLPTDDHISAPLHLHVFVHGDVAEIIQIYCYLFLKTNCFRLNY